jgi:hypothetical protein
MSPRIKALHTQFWWSILVPMCVLSTLGVLLYWGDSPGALAKTTERTITFPKDQVLGALFLGHYNRNIDERGPMNRVGGAVGTVKVLVPDGYYVMFEANRRVFQKPQLLNEISPDGIDDLKIGLLSMDDSEDKLCDAALAYIGHFSGVTTLDVERSDATDKGLSVLHKLKHLRRMCCFNSQVNGSYFKELVDLPEFAELDTAWCAIKPENFKYLPQLRKLVFLCVSRCGLEINGTRELAKCVSLTDLRVGQNPLFTDECVQLLVSLKRLEWLDLRDTAVTMKGIRTLRGLPLKKLNPPAALNTVGNVEEMKKLFPKVEVLFNSHVIPNDIKRTYAPLK